jgi:uncharacterized protein
MPEPSLLDRWFAAVRGGDAAAFEDIAAPDAVLLWNGDPSVIPWAGRYEGPQGIARFFQTQRQYLEYRHAAIVHMSESADGAVIVMDGTWRVRATGREVHVRWATVMASEDGRVTSYEVFSDTAAFVAALAPTT